MNRRLFLNGIAGGLLWWYGVPSRLYAQSPSSAPSPSPVTSSPVTSSTGGQGQLGDVKEDGIEAMMRNVCLRPLPYQLEWPQFYLSPDVEVNFRLHPFPKEFSPSVLIPVSLTNDSVFLIGRNSLPASYARKKVMNHGSLSQAIIHSYEGILKRCETTAVSLDTKVEVKGDDVLLWNDARKVVVKNQYIPQKASAAERFILLGMPTPGRAVSKFTDDRSLVDLPGYLLGVDDLGFALIDEGWHE